MSPLKAASSVMAKSMDPTLLFQAALQALRNEPSAYVFQRVHQAKHLKQHPK